MSPLDAPIAGIIIGFHPPRVHPDVTLRELCGVMAAHDADVAILEAPGSPVTLMTAADVVRAVTQGASLDSTTAALVAPGHQSRVMAGTPAVTAVATMVREGVTHALVLDEDGLVGVASLLDVVGHIFSVESTP